MSTIKRFIKRLCCNLYTKYVEKRALSCGDGLTVNRFSKVSNTTKLGKNVNFNGMTIYGAGTVSIGNNFHSGRDCLMISENHNYDNGDRIPYDSSYIAKDIIIEDNVWIGDRVIVLAGAHIGEGAIIQAGSVVVGNIPACAIAGGHPAVMFKKRDEEHYYSLKEKGLFH